MTLLNVAGLLREAPGATREVPLRDRYQALGADLELAGPLDGALRLHRTNRGILVQGWVEAPVRRTCARCLDGYVEPVRVTFAEEYLPSVDPNTGHPAPVSSTDAEVQRIDAHHQIDLTVTLHDEFALAEPMHPLCRPACPGLCAACGRRLDVGQCNCVTAEVDPRLAVLGRLLDAGRVSD